MSRERVVGIRGMAPLLQVFDMPASIRFYCGVLGFKIIQTSSPEDFGWALLGLNEMEIMLNTAYESASRPVAPDPVRTRFHRDTTLFFGCEDLDGLYGLLRAHAVDAKAPSLTGYGFRAVTVQDPDGYELCFHWPATQEAYDTWVERYGLPPKKIFP